MNLIYLDNIAKNALGDIKIPTNNNWDKISEKIKNNNISVGNSGSSQFASKLSSFFTSKIAIITSIIVAIVSIGTWFVAQNNTTNEKTLNAKKCVKVEIIPININRTIVYDTEKQDVVDNENENQDTDLAETVENNVAENNSNAQDSTEVPTVVVRRTIIINDTVPKNDSTEINK